MLPNLQPTERRIRTQASQEYRDHHVDSKVYLQEMGVNDRSTIIIATSKVIGKHNQFKIVQVKVENLQKRVNAFKSIFEDLFTMSLMSFWYTQGNLISQNNYLELLSKERNEDSKFIDMDKLLIGKVIIEKMSDDFNILSKFVMIVNRFPPFS